MARILIVDDSPTQTLSIAKILKKQGHEILTAGVPKSVADIEALMAEGR